MFPISKNQAVEAVIKCIQKNLVSFIIGSPGGSKSSIPMEIADNYNLELIDIRPPSLLPEDINGFAHINGEYSEYVPFDIFPVENTSLPKGKNGWLLFIDELPQASKEVQCALYKIILDRKVGNKKLNNKVAIVCAGNKESDNAFSNPLSTALKSRLIHFELEVTPNEWVKYAQQNKLDKRIIAFVNYRQNGALNFNPETTDCSFACWRTWTFLSSLIKDIDDLNSMDYLVAGAIGESMTFEFITFTNIFLDLPSINEIINNPKNIDIPIEPPKKYAIVQNIVDQLPLDKVDQIVIFIERLSSEFQALFAKSVMTTYPDIESINQDFMEYLLRFVDDV